jgi:hypothetical protein
MPKNAQLDLKRVLQIAEQGPYQSLPNGSVTYAMLGTSATAGIVSNLVNLSVLSVSTNTTLSNVSSVVLVNATSGSKTITLPAPSAGTIFHVKKTDSSLNTVVITPPSGTIDGAANKTLSYQYSSVSVVSDGTNFFLV